MNEKLIRAGRKPGYKESESTRAKKRAVWALRKRRVAAAKALEEASALASTA